MNKQTRHDRGFTLIEMMITVAILAILVGLAAPAFMDLIRNNRIQTQSQVLYSALVTARSEAVKRNQTVSILRSSASAGVWEGGWTIFSDDDADGAIDVGVDVAIRSQDPITNGVTLRTTGINFLTFRVDGSVSANGEFRICGEDGDESVARTVAVLSTGRAYAEKGVSSDCP